MLKTYEETLIKKDSSVGCIVGRFQVSELTVGHKELFDSVINRHQKMICIIGLSPICCTKSNPLNFEARRKMVSEEYPNIQVVYIKDMPDDKLWSKKLDDIISTHTPPGSNVILYGSRDSFMGHYHGKYPVKELLQESFTSGTADRINNSFTALDSRDFRKGAIWATQNQYDSCFPAVDIAIVDENENGSRLLLARKPNETLFRFVGGFVDPKEVSGKGNFFEQNARREVNEETHVETGDYRYLGSFLVDDWRYRDEKSKIVTTLFRCKYLFGKPTPDDDIDILKWFFVADLKKCNELELSNILVSEHIPLMVKFLND